jgi:hypothetical protein
MAIAKKVLALSVQAFGAVQDDALAALRRNTRVQSLAAARGRCSRHGDGDLFVGRSVLAVDAACVLEARVPRPSLLFRPDACRIAWARWRGAARAVAGYVWVFDLGALLFGKPVTRTAQSQVIVLEHQGLKLGVLVSDLEGVVRFESGQLRLAPAMAGAADQLVDRLIRANEGDLLIQCLNVAALVRMLKPPAGGAGLLAAERPALTEPGTGFSSRGALKSTLGVVLISYWLRSLPRSTSGLPRPVQVAPLSGS